MTKPYISVITPTVRLEGLKLIEKALRRQTLKDFEWIIVSPEKPENLSISFKWVKEPEKAAGDVWTLNKAYNKAISQSCGTLIVSWQDFTSADPETLERFFFHHKLEPHVLVGAVGNKYTDETFTVQTWQDPRQRQDQGTYYPCFFQDIEWNLCAVPKLALESVGGFDENLDKHYGMDGYSVNERIALVGGFDFKLDQSINSYSLEHGRVKDWEEKNALHGPYQERKKDYLKTPKLAYL